MLLDPEHVILDSHAQSRRALIDELAALLSELIDPDVIVEAVMARERLGSTGIGEGIAVPHGRVPNLEEPVLAIARHATGVDFDAIDEKPVRLVALLLVPDKDDPSHLELLARIVRQLRRPEVRARLLTSRDPAEIAALFSEAALAAAA